MPHKTLLSSLSIYTVCNVINALIPFLLLPILSRFLSPEEYGVFSIYILLVNCMVPFTGLQISRSILRNYIDQESIDISLYISSCFVMITISMLFITMIITSFSGFFSELFFFPQSWLWAPIIASYGQTYLAVSLGLLQIKEKPGLFGLVKISHSLLLNVSTFFLVVFFGWKWEGAIFGHTLSMLVIIPITFLILTSINLLKIKISYKYIVDALKYGIPLIPHVIGTVVITMTDRMFISYYIGGDAVGIYAIGYQMSLVLFILITSFNQAFTPWLFRKLKDGKSENKKEIVKIIYLCFLVIAIFSAILILISGPFITVYLDDSYLDSTKVTPWLLASFVFHGMYLIMGNFLYFSKKTVLISLGTLIGALSNLFLNYMLIPINGIIGAAHASIISFVIAFIFIWYFSNRIIKMPWFSLIQQGVKK